MSHLFLSRNIEEDGNAPGRYFVLLGYGGTQMVNLFGIHVQLAGMGDALASCWLSK
jgi:hypothetical protein|eukprot:COSAG01_NODE_3521_length_5979_cov_3.817347_6_plen_56_part_00